MPCVHKLLKLYFRIGVGHKEIISLLAHKHSVVVRIKTLERLLHYTQNIKLQELTSFLTFPPLVVFLTPGLNEWSKKKKGVITRRQDWLYNAGNIQTVGLLFTQLELWQLLCKKNLYLKAQSTQSHLFVNIPNQKCYMRTSNE